MWLQEIQQFAAGAATAPGVAATIQPLLGILQRVTGLESVFLTRISRGTQTVLFSHNTDQLQILAGMSAPWEDTLCSRALADERLLVNDVDERWPDSQAGNALGVKTYLTFPIRGADGTVQGTLCGASCQPVDVTPEAMAIVGMFAEVISAQLLREINLDTAYHRAERAEALVHKMAIASEIGNLCLEARDLHQTLKQVARRLEAVPVWRHVVCFRMQAGRPVVDEGQQPGDYEQLIRVVLEQLGDSVQYMHSRDNPPLLQGAEQVEVTAELRARLGLGGRGAVGVLTAATHKDLEGGILILADEPVAPTGGDGLLLIAVSNYLSLLAIRLRDYEQLQAANRELTRFALNDPLTGLPNRRYLFETVQRLVSQAARLGESVVVLFIDLDGFKQINDRFGHRSGDYFLVQFGRRLSAALREGDFAARYGGDEFVVLAVTPGSGEDAVSQQQARQFADRIGLALMGTFDLEGAVIDYRGPSIGVVIWDSDEDIEALLHRADKAMYVEKIRRRGPPPFTGPR
ncbi:sensor domain-containing diguanylate cyclase [Ectothiorhodospira shaposhnikovii]|uniref:sensor domain-containing diguanylate cyclase n=1 Tax=Ectothiorhodospira shaposhnikovii TaxID=1054 RepID=UPI001EE7F613|nr:sensor domain-containing diguanylate cyclase [Ectothiorhodospira shaposhnikovii]MCG5511702.1 GGDEF domain-containing protein [Ectothiorhodospira shaposhnikovii]